MASDADIPWLCDWVNYSTLVDTDNDMDRWMEAKKSRTEESVLKTLSYFDTVNFADRVGCRALVGVRRRDDVVPPATVYAVINHMAPTPEVIELPVSHTHDLEERHWWSSIDAGQKRARHSRASASCTCV